MKKNQGGLENRIQSNYSEGDRTALNKLSKVSLFATTLFAISAIALPVTPTASATDVTFEVNVKDSLSVTISTPTEAAWATGDAGDFLRNKISVNIVSNNSNGFTAGMTTGSANTYLTNTSKNTIHLDTLSSNWTRSNTSTTNFWGYSLDDDSETGTYSPMVAYSTTPITILSSSNGTTGSKDVYFGAKADLTQAAGTYAGTVVISVVTGTGGDALDQGEPVNPATPVTTDNTPAYNPSTGGSANGSTTYTYRSTNLVAATESVTTQVSEGNNTSSYNGYTPPQGVTENTVSNIASGSTMATVLATTASVAAASGILFFIVAKRKKDDDDEEEDQSQM